MGVLFWFGVVGVVGWLWCLFFGCVFFLVEYVLFFYVFCFGFGCFGVGVVVVLEGCFGDWWCVWVDCVDVDCLVG